MSSDILNFSNPTFLRSLRHRETFNLPLIAFAGRSNVGKSSVINTLCDGRYARISRTPGRTQLINLFDLGHLLLADLPGYGYAAISKSTRREWTSTLTDFLENTPLMCLVAIIDSRRPIDERDQHLLNLVMSKTPCLVLINKCDKLNRENQKKALLKAQSVLSQNTTSLLFSAKNKTGILELKKYLNELFYKTQQQDLII